MWDAATGALLHTIDGPTSEVEWLTWHSKGDVLLAGAADSTAWMWHVTPAAAKCMHVFAGEWPAGLSLARTPYTARYVCKHVVAWSPPVR